MKKLVMKTLKEFILWVDSEVKHVNYNVQKLVVFVENLVFSTNVVSCVERLISEIKSHTLQSTRSSS